MDWLNGFYVLVGMVTILGFIYALVVRRRDEHRKILACDISPAVSLVTILPDRAGHRLSIIYEKEGVEPVNINGAYLHFVRIANLGKEPIRREDLVTSDPLQLQILDATVLDIAVASVSRQVINFALSRLDETDKTISIAKLSFDFLDCRDGAVIRILTNSPSAKLILQGTIIGMPAGIIQVNELGGSGSRRLLRLLIVWLVMMLIIGGPFLFLFRVPGVSGNEFALEPKVSQWWAAAICVGSILIAMTLFRYFGFPWITSMDRRWPASLGFPDWFVSHYERDRLGIK